MRNCVCIRPEILTDLLHVSSLNIPNVTVRDKVIEEMPVNERNKAKIDNAPQKIENLPNIWPEPIANCTV